MVRSLARRLTTLETRRTAEPRAIGILDYGEHGAPSNSVQLVVPGGGGEHMTLDEWQRRYQHGTLIHVVYGEPDAERRQFEPAQAWPLTHRLAVKLEMGEIDVVTLRLQGSEMLTTSPLASSVIVLTSLRA
jgi:hypothetical protein